MKNYYICCSSCLFLLPSFLSLYINHKFFAYGGIVTTVVSINYWRHIEYGVRRDLDLVCSRIMCLVSSINYLYCSKNIYDLIVFCFLANISHFFYVCADFKTENWHLYHVLFHISLTVSAIITVYKMYSLTE